MGNLYGTDILNINSSRKSNSNDDQLISLLPTNKDDLCDPGTSNAEPAFSSKKHKNPQNMFGKKKSNPTPEVDSNISKRKKKQFEKYLAKKLKKDARPELYERLKKCSFDLGSGVNPVLLQSTKNLKLKRHIRDVKSNISNDHQIKAVRAADEYVGKHDDESENELEIIPINSKNRTYVTRVPDSCVNMNAEIAEIKRSSLNPLSEDDHKSSDEESRVENLNCLIPEKTSLPKFSTIFVEVNRSSRIEEGRLKLPVVAEEQRIMEAIQENPVVIICGETGSGKTTQVPQFLYEAGFGSEKGDNPGMIGITQPRRVAAVSMAQRVGFELSKPDHVAYQVRHDSNNITLQTRIKFMTDGILLRELSEDLLIEKYSIILLDEAHERNVNTDILIGMLSRVVKLRNKRAIEGRCRPLRLVIMSATLDVDALSAAHLFGVRPPVLQIEARQHPVTIHFSRTTSSDYLQGAEDLVRKIHSTLPPGALLVFLTGRHEISTLYKKLTRKSFNKSFASNDSEFSSDNDDFASEDDSYDSDFSSETRTDLQRISDEETNLTEKVRETNLYEDVLKTSGLKNSHAHTSPMHVLPLYAALPSDKQMLVFDAPPPGSRLIVLATNVAETSITIPDIRYVVDSGRVKEKHYDPITGAHRFVITWTSKASATQRAGRAGRVAPGHCYRLYSSAVFENQFPAHPVPEIQRSPLDSLVLSLRSLGIVKPESFPLPSPPVVEAVRAADIRLLRIGALSPADSSNESLQDHSQWSITDVGRQMSLFPIAPVWARIIVGALDFCNESAFREHQKKEILISLSIGLASTASMGDPFCEKNADVSIELKNPYREFRRKLAGKPPTSDLILALNVFLEANHAENLIEFCNSAGIKPKWVDECQMQFKLLDKQLNILRTDRHRRELLPSAASVNGRERMLLQKMIALSLADRVAERVILTDPEFKSAVRAVNPTIPDEKIKRGKKPHPTYRLLHPVSRDPTSTVVFLHTDSILYKSPPRFCVYSEILTLAAKLDEGSKAKPQLPSIRHVTAIELDWLPPVTGFTKK